MMNAAANAVLNKFASTGVETCFHDRHINPQIYADLNGSNWSIKDYEARGGYVALRKLLGKAPALIPSSKKRGSLGVVLDVPLGHKAAAYVRSHFDGMEVRIPDAPRAGEIVVAVALTSGGRPLPRVGGLTHAEAKGEDGLR